MQTEKMAAMRSSECLDSLEPCFRGNAYRWYAAMQSEHGIFPLVYFGFRSVELQQKLYDLYKAGKGGLAAPAGQSFHNYGLAFDWVPLMKVSDMPGFYDADWNNENYYKIGEEVSLKFAIRPITCETGHLQDARFKTWQDAKRVFESGLWPTV